MDRKNNDQAMLDLAAQIEVWNKKPWILLEKVCGLHLKWYEKVYIAVMWKWHGMWDAVRRRRKAK